MKTSNHELPSEATTTTTTLCDVNDSVEQQHIAIDSTSDDHHHHDFEHSSPSNVVVSTSTNHFSADSTAPPSLSSSATNLEQQPHQQQPSSRFYRSNSLIRIELDNEDDDDSSSLSISSTDSNSVDVNRSSTGNHATRRLVNNCDRPSYGHSYPHSDTECSPEPSSNSNGGNKDKKLTVLQPYNNQVGGHTQLMLLDQSTLCKPLVQRELLFYLNIPRELQEYVPNYKGVVEIRYCENNFPTLYHPNKRMNPSASLPSVPSTGSATSSSSSSLTVPGSWNKPELRVQLCTCNDRRLLQQELNGGVSSTGPSLPPSLSSPNCYSSRPSQRYFMLLENITSHYHLPCILDLKMGTRQHGEDASDEKRHRQMAKCAATTSASLGVRICGMQTYHKVADNNYRLYQVDKYYGRRIKNESGLQNELEIYFKNRPYLIGPVVKRLKELKSQVLATLRKRALRFYSTSLLIVSEGCSTAHRNRPIFKHRYSDGEEEDEEDEEEYFHDDDLQCGEDFESDEEDHFHDDEEEEEEVLGDFEESNDSSSSNDSTAGNVVLALDDDSSVDSSDVLKEGAAATTTTTSSSVSTTSPIESRYVPSKHYVCNRDHRRRSPPSQPPAPEFDVRMIDFAHTCFSSGSSTDGFTVGLENLIRLLNNIRGRGQQQMANKSDAAGEAVSSSGRNGKKRRRSSGHDSHQQQQHFRSHHHNHHHQQEQQHYSSRALKKNSAHSSSSSSSAAAQGSLQQGSADFLFSEETVMEPPNCDVTA